MTDAERRLWSILRGRHLRGYKFRRQRPLGPYILDFACLEYRLVIEADGGQHSDNHADEARTAWLEKRGWRVIRFWNNEDPAKLGRCCGHHFGSADDHART